MKPYRTCICRWATLVASTTAAVALLAVPAQSQRGPGKQPPPAQNLEKQKDLTKTISSWSVRALVPIGVVEHMAGALEAAPSNGTRILVMGGRSWGAQGPKTPNTNIYLFNPFSNSWAMMPMKCGLVGYTIAGEMGLDTLLFGANEGMPSMVYFYNPQSTSLTPKGQLIHTRRWPAVVLKNNNAEFLVIGGRDAQQKTVGQIEKFKGGSSTLVAGADVNTLPMSGISAALLPSGKVFLVGQKSPGDNRWTLFDPNNATAPFTGTQNFPSGSSGGRAQVAFSPLHNKLLVVIDPPSLPGGNIECFWVDPVTFAWSPAPVPSNPSRLGAVLVGTKAGFFLSGGAAPGVGTYKLMEQL
ncbi:hypothetical protein [Armatimonas sp.]|uniref:hypothetical protein n=1 Tax=Armatimonas sp. TaxID=1872638 RepID=UPI00374D0D87